MSSAEKFPPSPEAWTQQISKYGLQQSSIHDGLYKDSASEMKWEQFLLLRALHKPSRKASVISEDALLLLRDSVYFENAQQHLNDNVAWNNYLDDIDSGTKHTQRPFPNLGTFSLVRYYQNASCAVPVHAAASGQPKVAYMTRSQTAAARAAAIAAPSTPTKSSGGLDALSNKLDQFDLGSDTPSSLLSVESDGTWRGGLSPHSPISADQASLFRASRDEQIVNTALLAYLNALTIPHSEFRGDWSLHRQPFVLKNQGVKIFEARVDGYLHDHSSGKILALAEVKPFLRSSAEKTIKMQEAAQLAAWIHQSPPSKDEFSEEGYARRLLVSQDRHEIYLTTAEFDANYVEYICGRATSSSPSFLKLQEFGPFTTDDRRQMRALGWLLLAFSLEECQ